MKLPLAAGAGRSPRSSSRFSRGRGLVWVGTSCVAVVVLGGGSIPAVAAPAVSVVGKSVPGVSLRSVQQAAQQVAIASALAAAQATGDPVPVEGMITPTTQHVAMPDGTMQYEASSVPVRVEQDDTWVPVDTTLTAVGDWLEPVAWTSCLLPVPGSGPGPKIVWKKAFEKHRSLCRPQRRS